MLMISLLEPTSVADRQVGYYSVAIKLVEVALYFGTIVLNSFLPLFVQGKGKKEKGKSEQVKVPLEREQKCQDEEKERGCVS